jgi:hypothetical protein
MTATLIMTDTYPQTPMRASIIAVCLGVFVLSAHTAFAGQTVTIDGDVAGNVYGNGEGPDGTNPGGISALLDPNDNKRKTAKCELGRIV